MGNYCKSMGVGNTVDSASYAEATDHSTSAPLLVQAGWILTFQIIFLVHSRPAIFFTVQRKTLRKFW